MTDYHAALPHRAHLDFTESRPSGGLTTRCLMRTWPTQWDGRRVP